MSSLPHNDQPNLEENDALSDDPSLISALWDAYIFLPPDSPSESTSTFDHNDALIWPATRDTSHQPSKTSETIVPGNFCGGGTSDKSLNFDALFSLPSVDNDKDTQNIPLTVVPGLLQGLTDVPSSFLFPSNSEAAESRQVDENVNDSLSDVLRYTGLQKGKGKASVDEDFFLGSRLVRTPSPELDFGDTTTPEHPSIEEWVTGNRLILQDYSDRQISLPVGPRLEVSVKKPSQSILAALKLLVNRDPEGYTEPSRRLGPQLVENFAEIDRWANEYLRSRHHTKVVDDDVTSLLTIVINNFYDAQVQLIDALVTRALQNMRTGGRSSLSLQDFCIGFDFQMSQDLPFYVGETRSRFREPRPIHAVEVESTSEPVTTSSGREVKPTQRAQQVSGTNGGGKRNKGKNTPQVKGQQTANGSVTATRQKKSTAKPSSNQNVTEIPVQSEDVTRPTPPNTTAIHARYRPITPSNLGQSSILSFSPPTIATTPARSDNNLELAPSGSASADGPSITCSSGSNTTPQSLPRLSIKLPALSTLASIPHVTTDSGPTLTKSDNLPINASETATRGRRGSRARPRGPRNGGRGRGNRTVTATPDAEPPEATPDSATTLPTAHPVGVGDTTTSATWPTFDATAVFRKFFWLTNAAGTTASARPHREADNNTDTRDDDTSTSHRTPTDRSLAPPGDPGKPQGKKRKLDDCDD